MASSKVIFFLHCTGFAQLFSYAIAGTYDFSMCNHTAIVTVYDNVLKNHFPPEFKPRSVRCCPKQKANETSLDALLGCIHDFTQRQRHAAPAALWNDTAAALRRSCAGYAENNGSQNKSASRRSPRKCNQRKEEILKEVYGMWMQYKRSFK